jgi:hypothetical protein
LMTKLPLVVAAVLLICGVSGYAIAQSGSPTPKKIKACAKKKGGALRLSSTRCRRDERRVTWAIAGPRGLQGITGAQGEPGVPGAPGAPGTNGTSAGETFFDSDASVHTIGAMFCSDSSAGPSVTVDVPSGSYAQVMASVRMERVTATSNIACIRDNGETSVFATSTNSSPETRYIQAPGSTGAGKYSAQPMTFPLDAGVHTISMLYGSIGGTSSFSNRNLYVTVFHPTTP